MISGQTQVFGLLGSPVAHSLSPQIYNRLFKKHQINAVYLAFNTQKDAQIARAVRELGLSGVNLTIPHKERVLNTLDQLHLSAREAQAVNVIVNTNGQLTGYNTDGSGFIDSLLWAYPDVNLDQVALLGAGGAARAIGASLVKAGTQRLHLLNRSEAPMAQLQAHLSTLGPTQVHTHALSATHFSEIAPTLRLIVNCTAGPAAPLINTFPVSLLNKSAVWVDLNYWMKSPPALDSCRSKGVRILEGHAMLAWQAAAAARLFIHQAVNPIHVYTDLV